MTGSIRNFEKLNFTPKSSVFCFSQGQTSKYDRLAHSVIARESCMTGSIRIFEKLNFTPKLSALAFLKVKLPNMIDWHTVKPTFKYIKDFKPFCNYVHRQALNNQPILMTIKHQSPVIRRSKVSYLPRLQS